ncbi:MAG: hypothetical protein KYX64_09315 [Sphingopyxis sp.]|nr:hypothetical protein [Sphingopyxis sp.]
MMDQTYSYDTADVSYIRHCTAAADDPFYQTAASPESLASLMRSHIVLRDAETPISFPFVVEEVSGYYRRAG